ncbi:uncharacterized protein LOC132747708 [Ruditapes philippinarum]|uniref:uncharacterized protein LOC132747708 n=1 Tax=Ruditapes philippinarum TaxID=129788 RepID=UPI00295A7CCE|nr:uncharacterized protein LOC132747708 [Ruditapes philippinarum]
MLLIAFLTKEDKEQSALFEDRTAENKEDWCLRVAQHLFSQLSYSGEYTIDSGYEGSNRKSCPCSNKDELVGKFGDTSFGCRTLWHGSADLIFGVDMPVKLVQENTDMSKSESASSDTVEMETSNTENDFSLNDKYEMRGQVIGFGFYVNKLERQKENPKYFLTPHIGISKEKIKFLFYDSAHDVLLETSAHKLCCYGNQLSYHIILTVWLVMNYKLFGGETPAILRRYKSGFHSMFPSKLKVYIDDVKAPCHVDSSLLKEDHLPNYCKYVSSDVVEVRSE